MKPGKKTWWLAALVSFFFALVMLTRSRPEPVYNGRTFSSWFHEAEVSRNLFTDGPPVQAIRAMGTDAVPLLADRVRHPESALLQYYWRRYPRPSPWMRRWLPEPRRLGARQEFAAMMLYELGADAHVAMPELIAAYDQIYGEHYHRSGSHVDWANEYTNAPVTIPAATGPPREPIRVWILLALTRCGDDSKQTIPLIFAATHESDLVLRDQAYSWLQTGTNLATAIGLVVPFELARLADSNPAVRAGAANVLGRVPPGHPEIIAPLLGALEDPHPDVRQCAYHSLQNVHPDLALVVPVLGRLISTNTGIDRGRGVRVIYKSVGVANVIPTLSQLLDNTNASVRTGAAQCLAAYGSAAQAAVPRLQQLTNASSEPDESVRRAVIDALSRINPPTAAP